MVALHGLIHVLGVAKGFGGSEVSTLKQPVGLAVGVMWLLAGMVRWTGGGWPRMGLERV